MILHRINHKETVLYSIKNKTSETIIKTHFNHHVEIK